MAEGSEGERCSRLPKPGMAQGSIRSVIETSKTKSRMPVFTGVGGAHIPRSPKLSENSDSLRVGGGGSRRELAYESSIERFEKKLASLENPFLDPQKYDSIHNHDKSSKVRHFVSSSSMGTDSTNVHRQSDEDDKDSTIIPEIESPTPTRPMIKDILSKVHTSAEKSNVFGEAPTILETFDSPSQRAKRIANTGRPSSILVEEDKDLPPNPPLLPSQTEGLKSDVFEPITMHKALEEAIEFLNTVQREAILSDEELLHFLRLYQAATDSRLLSGRQIEKAKAVLLRADMSFLQYHLCLAALEKEMADLKFKHSTAFSKIPRPTLRPTRTIGTQFEPSDVPGSSHRARYMPSYSNIRSPSTPLRTQGSTLLQTPTAQVGRRTVSPSRLIPNRQTPLSAQSSKPSIRTVSHSNSPSPIQEGFGRSSPYPPMNSSKPPVSRGYTPYSERRTNASSLSVVSPAGSDGSTPKGTPKSSSGYSQKLLFPRRDAGGNSNTKASKSSLTSVNTALGGDQVSPGGKGSERSRSRLGGFTDRLRFGSRGKKTKEAHGYERL
ncbi:hypothetical protein BJ508DRAFT_320535 [Ascobolus immersus RN42]|uniref:Uncharacterized protein n=1 Tax=Ascobolus immersus RN42 TaxID=1160509 RepID=A0A3N4IN20_ASCIM|nr:hypothetical protein BJ508DRAFT_320535 [Ascobolus immersus RN42]